MSLDYLEVGDLMVVNTGNSLSSQLIRAGAALENEVNLDDHVAIVHHRDEAGTLWVIEGRPGGVGYAAAAKYDNQYVLTTATMPKTIDQRNFIAAESTKMLGTPYDWQAIMGDIADALLHLNYLWGSKDFGPLPPAHVVCSSYAVWLYWKAGLMYPTVHTKRDTTPADWSEFILKKAWT